MSARPVQKLKAPNPMVATLLLTISAKSIAAIAFTRASSGLQWLTPGVAMGLAAGAAGVALLFWLAPWARAALAALGVVAIVVIVNITPDNPYQTLPAFTTSVQTSHLANFGGIVRILSQCWPLAAVLLLLGLARAGPVRFAR